MATDDNAVRLKHLQSFAKNFDNNLTIQNGDNVVRLKHLVSLASFIADESIATDKQTPVLSIGSWSAVDSVYSAPITYNGDGALSVNVGSISDGSLIIADDDGIFSGVITASAGDSFAGTALNFNYNTDVVTVQGGSVDSDLVTLLGSKFVPTVSSADDFTTYSDYNIQFFDNRLQKILNDDKDFSVKKILGNIPMLWGNTSLGTIWDEDIGALCWTNFANGSKVSISESSSSTTYFSVSENFKISEVAIFSCHYMQSLRSSHYNYGYEHEKYLTPVYLNSNDEPIIGSSVSIVPANSSVIADNSIISSDITFAKSYLRADSFFVFYNRCYGNGTKIFYYRGFNAGDRLGKLTSVSGGTCGTLYSSSAGKYDLESAPYFKSQYTPVINFNGEDVIVSKGATARQSPFLFWSKRTNATKTNGSEHVAIYTGFPNEGANSCTLTSLKSGVASSLNPWLEDDNNVILGLYPHKDGSNCYAITYLPGTYNKDDWLDDAFTTWLIDFHSPKFIKSNKKLIDIVDDIVL